MQTMYHFHLFVARIEEHNAQAYHSYVFDKQKYNPNFFRELGIGNSYGDIKDNYGLEVLNPDFRYEFSLSELLKMTLLKNKNLPTVENFCKQRQITSNSYIILYDNNLSLPNKMVLSYPNLYYVGEFEMDEEALISKQILYPHLFNI